MVLEDQVEVLVARVHCYPTALDTSKSLTCAFLYSGQHWHAIQHVR